MSSEIMAKDKIQEILEKIAGEFPLGDFYLPDGIAPVPYSNVHILPYDRLLIVLEGVKNEAMSIHGELRVMKLKKGDFFLVRKNMWENASFNEIHEILCIIPQGSFLRIAHHFVMVPNASNPWDRVDWFHTAVISDSILHAFTLLASVENSKYAAVIVRLIASLAIDDMQKELPYSRKAQMTFENIRNFIEFHFNEPLTRNEIAKYFNLNHCLCFPAF